jgi:hypothetical protein
MSEVRQNSDVICRYFRKPGKANTRHVLAAAAARARDLAIDSVLVPSVSGKTALAAREIFDKKTRVIAVTHVTGFEGPDIQEMNDRTRGLLVSRGVPVFTGQHAFGGVGRAVRNKLGTYQVDEIMAWTLRTFGQGTKVAVEIALMAADAGLVRTDADILSLGGSGEGVDTALLIRPANSSRFFDLKVREVICKPRDF